MTHRMLYQGVVTVKYNSVCGLECAAVCCFVRHKHEALAIKKGALYQLCSSFHCSVICNETGVREYLDLMLLNLRQLIKDVLKICGLNSVCVTHFCQSGFEGAFNGCPIFSVLFVTLAGLTERKQYCTLWLLLCCC